MPFFSPTTPGQNTDTSGNTGLQQYLDQATNIQIAPTPQTNGGGGMSPDMLKMLASALGNQPQTGMYSKPDNDAQWNNFLQSYGQPSTMDKIGSGLSSAGNFLGSFFGGG